MSCEDRLNSPERLSYRFGGDEVIGELRDAVALAALTRTGA
jgi:hypothetical protein